jgi:hypothetical protein
VTARTLIALCSGLIVMAAAFLLITSSPLLTMPFIGIEGLPSGTLITWVGLIALPMMIYAAPGSLHPPETVLDRIMSVTMRCLLALAVLWVPVSYWLAGNLGFNFGNTGEFRGGQTALFYFFYYSIALVVMPLFAAAVYALLRFALTRTH